MIGNGKLRHLNNLFKEIDAFLKDTHAFIRRVNILFMLVGFALLALACSPARIPPGMPSSEPISSPNPTVTEEPIGMELEIVPTSAPVFPDPTPTVQITRTATILPNLPVFTPTPDIYGDLSIQHLASRSYGGGEISVQEVLKEDPAFTRYLFSYPSDGLTIYGFLNIPKQGPEPFPVVIALHGYIDPAVYETLDYTTPYADILARAGYIVFHPNLRGYSPSQNGPNLFRVGMAIDVLNLIALVKEQAGIPGPLEAARANGFGLWGHSMGGGISLRVATVSPDIRAAILYGAMSGDEKRNFEAIAGWSDYQRGLEELQVPESELQRISPIFYLDRIGAKISIHHGEQDQLVPVEWSLDLFRRLSDLGKDVECITYPGQLHTFNASGSELFMQRVIELFDRELR